MSKYAVTDVGNGSPLIFLPLRYPIMTKTLSYHFEHLIFSIRIDIVTIVCHLYIIIVNLDITCLTIYLVYVKSAYTNSKQ